jgi:hypothetical protein
MDINEMAKGISRHVSEQDFQYGVQDERERIIELLEEAGNSEIVVDLDELIALIKGQNK